MVKVLKYAKPTKVEYLFGNKFKKKERKMVNVLSKKGNPLMQCENVVARLLLKQKKAKVRMTLPFTIQLLDDSTEYTQHLHLTLDSGSSKVGAAVLNNKNEVIYMSEIENRNDVSEKMTRRAKYRRMRRNRKTRYRECRILNRGNSIRIDRFSPTITSKINSHLKELKFIMSILPISEITIETASFDPHALKNPDVLKDLSLYQKGINYGFANTKAYVLNRDSYKCQNPKCNCEIKKPKLEVHHIVFRSNGGSDEQENLITLCKQCHDGIHDGTVILAKKGKKKNALKHATQMNSIRVQLLRRIPEAKETFGFITKEHRQLMGLPKEHYFDAVAIASKGNNVTFKTENVLIKKFVSKGDYRLRKGISSEMVIPIGKIQGFRKFDKVEHKRKEYFIKGRMSSGYAILMDIESKKIALKPMPKFSEMKRISARKSWIIDSQKMKLNEK
jgi:hypothetical protein